MPAYKSFHQMNLFAVVDPGNDRCPLQPVLSMFSFDHHQIPDVLGSTSTLGCETPLTFLYGRIMLIVECLSSLMCLKQPPSAHYELYQPFSTTFCFLDTSVSRGL